MNRQINWRWLGRLGAGLLMLSGVLASAHTPVVLPKEEWVARYNGPGNGDDGAYALAVDGTGNVYVTGDSYSSGTSQDYATLKYDRKGKLLWERRYNGPGNDWDNASALAVDGAGNVYVTGGSYGGDTGGDYATLKYDKDGNLLWESRYSSGQASALAVDGAGNVYVTGFSYNAIGDTDYATLKYDRDGTLLWEKRYNGPGNGVDAAYALAVDGAGNVYVTGQSDGAGTQEDYATLKYDKNGTLLWESRYNGPGNGDDWASRLALDGAGNVYVTGNSWDAGTGSDYATLKYDRNGKLLWVHLYNGPRDSWDDARALAVDGAGNVYVTGYSDGAGTDFDYATLKYDRNGTLLWESRYNGPGNGGDYVRALAVDGAGNVYVTGSSSGAGTGSDYATLKYDKNGKLLWEKRYNGPDNSYDVPSALAVDNAGNVYVTGSGATIKYSQKPHYKLTLAIRGSGTGTVSSMPEGLNSDHDTTSAYFEKGSRVALTAVPTEDSTFAGWDRDCSGTGRCTVKMNDNQFVTATFTAPRYLLTVSKQGNGLGRVVSSPGGIDCGQGCAADSADYLKGTPVKLIADPKANSRFAGWSGACTGTAACVVTVNQALNVSATFTLR